MNFVYFEIWGATLKLYIPSAVVLFRDKIMKRQVLGLYVCWI